MTMIAIDPTIGSNASWNERATFCDCSASPPPLKGIAVAMIIITAPAMHRLAAPMLRALSVGGIARKVSTPVAMTRMLPAKAASMPTVTPALTPVSAWKTPRYFAAPTMPAPRSAPAASVRVFGLRASSAPRTAATTTPIGASEVNAPPCCGSLVKGPEVSFDHGGSVAKLRAADGARQLRKPIPRCEDNHLIEKDRGFPVSSSQVRAALEACEGRTALVRLSRPGDRFRIANRDQ